jgi:hypothetical protein
VDQRSSLNRSLGLRTKIPLDFRSVTFALIMSTLWSVPLSYLTGLGRDEPYMTLPDGLSVLYGCLVASSAILLPLWTYFVLRRTPVLQRLGKGTCCILLIGILLSFILFPAIQ